MLDEALKVVEAARAIGLQYKDGKTSTDLDVKTLAKALNGLRQSIENFDSITGYGVGDFTAKMKPDFSVPEQIADEGYVEEVQMKNPTSELRMEHNAEVVEELEMEENLELEAEEKNTLENQKQNHPLMELPKPVLAAAVLSQMGSKKKGLNNTNSIDLGDGVFYDGDESATDLLMAMDAINDKLTYAVRKIGWSPRLRRMAEALRKAQEHMVLEIKGEHGYVRIPAAAWGPLSIAIAESALDQDLSIALPQPKPNYEKRYEQEQQYKNAPRPSNIS